MVWTDSLTNFSDGNTPTAAQFNPYIANMEWLHAPPEDAFEDTAGSDITTTSTTWGTISSDYALTLETTGGLVFLMLSVTTLFLDLDISVDGTRITSSGTSGTGCLSNDNVTGNAYRQTINIPVMFDDIAAGTHTFAAQWKVPSAGTGTIYGAYKPRFYVREL